MDSLMNIVFVYPGKPNENDPGSVTDMLSLIFSDTLDVEKRQKLLEERYKIQLDLFSLMDVFKVTDYVSEAREEGYEDGKAEGYRDGVAEGKAEGKAEGLKEGKAEGLKEGKIRKSAESIVGIMQKFGCSLEEALDAVGVSEEDKGEVLGLVKEIQKKA